MSANFTALRLNAAIPLQIVNNFYTCAAGRAFPIATSRGIGRVKEIGTVIALLSTV